jgi:alkanesulfonate monooxygenase SsuD/methylene tetrahydromethanopterin reductase-like flavin-dependent oxidoreductase (luciferase family)
LKDLWTKEQSAFEGQHVSFTRSWLYPKPVQSPHPPIIVGAGAGPQNFADIMKYGDGWLPLTVYAGDRLADQLASFWASAEEHGRAPGSLEVTLSDCDLGLVDISFEEFTAARQRPKILEYYAGLGIHRLVVGVPFFDRDRTLACLDDIAALVPIAESL